MFKLLAARLVVFAAAVLWVIGWLGMCLVVGDLLMEELVDIQPGWASLALQVWFVGTTILVDAWAAMKGFRFVGKWTREPVDAVDER